MRRPKGSKNYKTIFEEAAKQVATTSKLGKEPDKVSIELIKEGIKKGLDGSFPFYKDILDRLYGEAKKPLEDGFSIDVTIEKDEQMRKEVKNNK